MQLSVVLMLMNLNGKSDRPVSCSCCSQIDNELFWFSLTDSVFTARMDPKTCDLVITGGQDDIAYVWSASSGETKFQCDG